MFDIFAVGHSIECIVEYGIRDGSEGIANTQREIEKLCDGVGHLVAGVSLVVEAANQAEGNVIDKIKSAPKAIEGVGHIQQALVKISNNGLLPKAK